MARAPLLRRKEEVDYKMKKFWTIGILMLMVAFFLTACSRASKSPYYGAAYKMNFGRQIANPEASSEEELPATSGAIAEQVYQRHADTYDQPIPPRLQPVGGEVRTGLK